MLKVENRESAHLRSRVKDESVVPNVVSFTGLFECITPISKADKKGELYEPVLIRDVDSLIANFGDPRIDPEKYIDLYSIMNIVGNGTSCYVAKVPSGDTGEYEFAFVPEKEFGENHSLIDAAEEASLSTSTPLYGEISNNSIKLLHPSENNSLKLHSEALDNKYTIDSLGKAGNNDYYAYTTGNDINAIVVAKNTTQHGIKILFTITGESPNRVATFKYQIGDSEQVEIHHIDENELSTTVTFTENDLNSVESSPVTFKITDNDGWLINLDGSDNIPETAPLTQRDKVFNCGELDSSNYEYTYEKVGDKFILSVTLKLESPEEAPKYVFINEASIDQDWAPEGANETSYSAIIPLAPTSEPKVFTHDFKREYTIIEIKDDDVVVSRDKYTYTYNNGTLIVTFDEDVTAPAITKKASRSLSITGSSSMTEDLTFDCSLVQAKPYSLKAFYLKVTLKNGNNVLGTASIKLDSTTTNQTIVNNLNSVLGTYVRFELVDPSTAGACEVKEEGEDSIAAAILYMWATNDNGSRKDLDSKPAPTSLPSPAILEKASFEVRLQNYIDTLNQYSDKRYAGCLLSDFTAPVNQHTDDNGDLRATESISSLTHEERRALHYYLKQVASLRKDCNVILSAPLYRNEEADSTYMTMDEVCDWVASQKDFADLWEYGETNTTDYSKQSFYLEMYYSWLDFACTKIENGIAKSTSVKVAPSNLVCNNILVSYRERGTQFPVAGDQYGTLSDQCTIINNPRSKEERDQLVQYRINPIWDTGTRGIQIYGNETLNAGYTDLNAAHIARTLVYIRNRIEEYTETLKFLINSQILWDTWKNYVSSYILDSLKSENAISSYSIAMGTDTTSAAEIANRQINGVVSLTFYQSAEIFDLTFVVYSSATSV